MAPLETSCITFWTLYIASWELESHSVHDEVGREGQHQVWERAAHVMTVLREGTHSDQLRFAFYGAFMALFRRLLPRPDSSLL